MDWLFPYKKKNYTINLKLLCWSFKFWRDSFMLYQKCSSLVYDSSMFSSKVKPLCAVTQLILNLFIICWVCVLIFFSWVNPETNICSDIVLFVLLLLLQQDCSEKKSAVTCLGTRWIYHLLCFVTFSPVSGQHVTNPFPHDALAVNLV